MKIFASKKSEETLQGIYKSSYHSYGTNLNPTSISAEACNAVNVLKFKRQKNFSSSFKYLQMDVYTPQKQQHIFWFASKYQLLSNPRAERTQSKLQSFLPH